MIENVIGKQKDVAGRTRFFVLPIENEEGFKNLVEFVSQEFLCDFGPLDEGPGTLVRKGAVEGASLVFVLSDSTGVQFYAESEKDLEVSERIAARIESRLRAVMK